MSDPYKISENRIRYYIVKELNKWDRVELELKNGSKADFMAVDHIIEVLPKALVKKFKV